jgi:hypothetical protein
LLPFASSSSSGDKIFGLFFQPNLNNPMDDSRLVTCGHRHMTFWKRTDRTHIESSNARFGRELAGEVSVVDVCFDCVGRTIAATNLGHLLVFQTGSNSKSSGYGGGKSKGKNNVKQPVGKQIPKRCRCVQYPPAVAVLPTATMDPSTVYKPYRVVSSSSPVVKMVWFVYGIVLKTLMNRCN